MIIQFLLKCIHKGPINKKTPPCVGYWGWKVRKPLSEPTMTCANDAHVRYAAWSQWFLFYIDCLWAFSKNKLSTSCKYLFVVSLYNQEQVA